jgi:hypothetical protein
MYQERKSKSKTKERRERVTPRVIGLLEKEGLSEMARVIKTEGEKDGDCYFLPLSRVQELGEQYGLTEKSILVTHELLSQYDSTKELKGLARAIRMKGTEYPEGYRVMAEAYENLKVDYGLAPIRGVGDVIGRVTKSLGLVSCLGCDIRRRLFNRLKI